MISQQNVHITTSFPEAYFQLLRSSKNGSYHRVKTLQKTKRTVITAVYTSIEVTLKIDNYSLLLTSLNCMKTAIIAFLALNWWRFPFLSAYIMCSHWYSILHVFHIQICWQTVTVNFLFKLMEILVADSRERHTPHIWSTNLRSTGSWDIWSSGCYSWDSSVPLVPSSK